MKVDVSVQSFNKPESLIYSLLCLHSVSKDRVDTVWINDDHSDPGVVEKYVKLVQDEVLAPWKINIRVNKKRSGWWVAFVRGARPEYQTFLFRLKRMIWNYLKTGGVYSDRCDIRYQWAVENTSNKLLFIMHDDIFFKRDIIGLYISQYYDDLGAFQAKTGIVGDLGQCWRCQYADSCNPSDIIAGKRPNSEWPLTQRPGEKHKWACRINEWSCLLNVEIAKEIFLHDRVFFGNYDDDGDVAAYWFSRLIKRGFGFSDPLPSKLKRDDYYTHWEDGNTGHSAWVDQGVGKKLYNSDIFVKRLKEEFGYAID